MSPAPDFPLSRTGRDAATVASDAAEGAGAILLDLLHKEKGVTTKGRRNLVTQADLEAERHILDLIRREFPSHGILSEESGGSKSPSEYRWIVDPLDGTTNYAFGIPFFTVSIALLHHDDVLVGVIHDPVRGETFRAEKGRGAFLNGRRISVAREREFDVTIIGFDLGYDDARTREMLSLARDLWSGGVTFRLTGSAALGMTYVACGRMDIYFHRRIYPWDIAAAMLLVREAGGAVTDWRGVPASVWEPSVIACGNEEKHRDLISALRKPFA